MAEKRTGHHLPEKHDKVKSYGRPGHRWKDRIKLRLKFGQC